MRRLNHTLSRPRGTRRPAIHPPAPHPHTPRPRPHLSVASLKPWRPCIATPACPASSYSTNAMPGRLGTIRTWVGVADRAWRGEWVGGGAARGHRVPRGHAQGSWVERDAAILLPRRAIEGTHCPSSSHCCRQPHGAHLLESGELLEQHADHHVGGAVRQVLHKQDVVGAARWRRCCRRRCGGCCCWRCRRGRRLLLGWRLCRACQGAG